MTDQIEKKSEAPRPVKSDRVLLLELAAQFDGETRALLERAAFTEPLRDKWAAAFAKAQGAFKVPQKTKTAKVRGEAKGSGREYEYSYKYSTLDDLIEATRPALSENGLACFQDVGTDGAKVSIVTWIVHSSGQYWKTKALTITAESANAQKLGAAETYARRYSMSAALGVAAEEDEDAQTLRERAQEQARAGSGNRRPVQKPNEHDQRQPGDQPADGFPANELPPENTKQSAKTETTPVDQNKKIGKGDLAHYPNCINGKQIKRMFSIAKRHNVSDAALRAFLKDGGFETSDRIAQDKYDGILFAIQNGHVGDVK